MTASMGALSRCWARELAFGLVRHASGVLASSGFLDSCKETAGSLYIWTGDKLISWNLLLDCPSSFNPVGFRDTSRCFRMFPGPPTPLFRWKRFIQGGLACRTAARRSKAGCESHSKNVFLSQGPVRKSARLVMPVDRPWTRHVEGTGSTSVDITLIATLSDKLID